MPSILKVSIDQRNKLITISHLLAYAYAGMYILLGLDVFFNLTASWHEYMSCQVIAAITFMKIPSMYCMYGIGLLKITIGLLSLSKWYKYGMYAALAWCCIVLINLSFGASDFYVLLQGITLALVLYALILLYDTIC